MNIYIYILLIVTDKFDYRHVAAGTKYTNDPGHSLEACNRFIDFMKPQDVIYILSSQ
jgi:hypothetical protein